MNTAEIEAKISELERELEHVEGTPTEIYTRIVGYYRSLKNWNRGKREEYRHRKTFTVAESMESKPQNRIGLMEREEAIESAEESHAPSSQEIGKVLFFSRKHCPNCPPMKSALESAGIAAEVVDVDSDAGFDLARTHEILATPTVLMIGAEGGEIRRITNPLDLKNELQETA